MNENPDGTPNPLNPNPAATPESSVAKPETAAPAVETVVVESESVVTPVEDAVVAVPSEPAPAKKSKKAPFIITAIILLLVAVGCGVAALFILKPLHKDAVPAAIAKLFNDRPDYVLAKGTISVKQEDASLDMETVFITGIDNKNHQNYVNATIDATLGDEKDIELDVDEVHTSAGNLYLKVSGIAEVVRQFTTTEPESTKRYVECVSAEDCDISDPDGDVQPGYVILNSLGMLEVIDDEWIQIPGSAFSTVSDLGVLNDAPTQCLIDAAGKINKYSDDLANIYNNNSFITYSTDNLAITSKQDTLYRIGFDAEKLADFANAMDNSGFVNELRACLGVTATNAKANASDLAAVIAELPEIYVEIDNNNNFTRVYLTLEHNSTSFKVDISLSYPSSIDVEEPKQYITFNDLLSQVLGTFFDTDMLDYGGEE